MTFEYNIPTTQLQNGIMNTIRVIDDYRLDRKTYINSTYKILVPTQNVFYQYQVFKTEKGSQLKVFSGLTVGKKMTEENAVAWINSFIANLEMVLNKQVVLTPETLNKDVYKSGQMAMGLLQLIILIVSIIAIVTALKVLL